MDVVFSGIIAGLALSLIFIGPVFFLLLETSINKGWKQAIALDLGVIACDLMFIFAFYYGMKDANEIIAQNPELKNYMYRIGGIVMLVYGAVLLFKKENFKSMRKKMMKKVSTNFLGTFMNGFLLNFLNVGVIFFWFGMVSTLSQEYNSSNQFLLFIGIAFGTFFGLDLIKIFLAQKVKKVLNFRNTIVLRKVMGIVLIVFSGILISKSYGAFSTFDEKMESQFQDKIQTN